MHTLGWKRAAAGIAALSLGLGGFLALPATAAEQDLTVLTFTDFHGRITNLDFFATLDQMKTTAGADRTALLSVGDNVGASIFESSILDDEPTLAMLNAIGVDASAVGNHEFDRGWTDLRDRIAPHSDFPYVAANISGVTPDVQPYTIIEKNGVKIGYIGATTSELPGLVSPAGLVGLTVTDPATAVNKVADQLTDGDPANGEADVLIAGYHEGASEALTAATSPKVDIVLDGHTHVSYVKNDGTRTTMQAGNYGEKIGQITLGYDAATDKVTVKSAAVVAPTAGLAKTYTSPAFDAAKKISAAAVEESAVEGAAEVATATGPLSRGGMGNATPGEDRGAESTLSDLIANMFRDVLTDVTGQPVIGIQNPGGTRADLAAGTVTYKQAATILPFANTLKTTEITGAQFKTMLEQQWQRDAAGAVPTRPFLALSLSDNVSWTFDESRPEGDRVTSIIIDGTPIDPTATYTVGSGNFLIEGGDNFRVLAGGKNTTDTGWSDLDAWTTWLKQQQTIAPSYAKLGVEVSGLDTRNVAKGAPVTVTVGDSPATAPVAKGSLDMNSVGFVKNTTVTARIGEVQVGTAAVTDGRADLSITVPCTVQGTSNVLTLTAADSGTTVTVPVTLTTGSCDTQNGQAGDDNSQGNAQQGGNDQGGQNSQNGNAADTSNQGGNAAANLARTGGPAALAAVGALALVGAGTLLVRRFR
ncbi:bifunctional UDP-sugar hydrolase/5'-nucleotidase [Raineyella sp. LH-20]|uniref:bifunctional metallophosphatase/5'-nucleotidase n=1 Tax=Raineyella sp. LH-20 TaxID=3081204 RepID=UPI002953B3A3|nr:bifunctional UDP-sugar hydrolase/5'-nucleotidase [Raineyella sp. LH-20]WOP19498.1 bifunctional UDP-sugar hydrolase/5'-nucleotidase [Raineyella sp. LH-20]